MITVFTKILAGTSIGNDESLTDPSFTRHIGSRRPGKRQRIQITEFDIHAAVA